MKPPRIKISTVMIMVAVVGLNLAVIKAPLSVDEEGLLTISLPMVDILFLVGIVGFRRWRAFVLGFEIIGSLSLLSFIAWPQNFPWTCLSCFDPMFQAILPLAEAIASEAYPAIMVSVIAVVFAIPHTILGLAGGYLTAKGWAMTTRRRRV